MGAARGKRRTRRAQDLVMPPQIPDTPEMSASVSGSVTRNVAKAVLGTPPNKRRDWDYLKERAR